MYWSFSRPHRYTRMCTLIHIYVQELLKALQQAERERDQFRRQRDAKSEEARRQSCDFAMAREQMREMQKEIDIYIYIYIYI